MDIIMSPRELSGEAPYSDKPEDDKMSRQNICQLPFNNYFLPTTFTWTNFNIFCQLLLKYFSSITSNWFISIAYFLSMTFYQQLEYQSVIGVKSNFYHLPTTATKSTPPSNRYTRLENLDSNKHLFVCVCLDDKIDCLSFGNPTTCYKRYHNVMSRELS